MMSTLPVATREQMEEAIERLVLDLSSKEPKLRDEEQAYKRAVIRMTCERILLGGSIYDP
mgnify:FL=1